MTDAVTIALIALGGGVVAAVPPSIFAWRAGKIATIAAIKTEEGNGVVKALATTVDGRMSEWVSTVTRLLQAKDQVIAVKDERIASIGEQEHAKGVLEGKSDR